MEMRLKVITRMFISIIDYSRQLRVSDTSCCLETFWDAYTVRLHLNIVCEIIFLSSEIVLQFIQKYSLLNVWELEICYKLKF